MRSRRMLLRRMGVVGGGIAGMVVGLPAPPTSYDSINSDASESRSDDSELPWTTPITEENQTPVARYQYYPGGNEIQSTAPINIVFPLAGTGTTLSDVMGVLRAVGWISEPEEYPRFAWNRREQEYVLQHETAAETYFGTTGRMHVRCWSFENVVSMQAHEDSGARPNHVVESYDRARAKVESLFAADGWTVVPSVLDLHNEEGDHDGMATIITPSAGHD